jgi:predicted nucleic acid-binding Zn ribbon protein
MTQPYLFRDLLHIECIVCGQRIQEGDTLNAPKVQEICEECEDRQHEMEAEYVVSLEKVDGVALGGCVDE